jgi:hypothetical protein
MTSQTLPLTTLPTRPGFTAWMDTENVYIYQTTEQGMKPRMIPLKAPLTCSSAILPAVKNKRDWETKRARLMGEK